MILTGTAHSPAELIKIKPESALANEYSPIAFKDASQKQEVNQLLITGKIYNPLGRVEQEMEAYLVRVFDDLRQRDNGKTSPKIQAYTFIKVTFILSLSLLNNLQYTRMPFYLAERLFNVISQAESKMF